MENKPELEWRVNAAATRHPIRDSHHPSTTKHRSQHHYSILGLKQAPVKSVHKTCSSQAASPDSLPGDTTLQVGAQTLSTSDSSEFQFVRHKVDLKNV
jgi:hypothetical protein